MSVIPRVGTASERKRVHVSGRAHARVGPRGAREVHFFRIVSVDGGDGADVDERFEEDPLDRARCRRGRIGGGSRGVLAAKSRCEAASVLKERVGMGRTSASRCILIR